MTTIATSMSESATVKTRSLGTPCRLAASREPPTAARPPARAKARSFVRVFETVYAAAVSGLSRTAIVPRPMPVARRRDTRMMATTRTTRVT